MAIKKTSTAVASEIRKQPVDAILRFSFSLFDHSDGEICPPNFRDGYTQSLMQRLRDLSTWTVRQFTGTQVKAVRNHQHEWHKTTRPAGFSHLNEHYRAISGWQFSVSVNEHGRVHGIIIDDTFYVIWLDHDHILYPDNSN